MYYAMKNNKKTKFNDLDNEYLEQLLKRFKISPRGNWIEIITSELKQRDRISKIHKLKSNIDLRI